MDHALPGLLESALRKMVLQDRRRRLLDLEEQRVLLVATLEQDDERTRPDAPDADDLARDIDDLEPLQQMTAIALQGGSIGAELLVEHVSELVRRHLRRGGEISERDHDRRLR